mmetsp:Transcript_20803/g.31270  ORF Transcript_20803/g.31270 Transcript_20803/m.31270 type:complete len:245 (+) Transcript_20803:855-1589(+)
MMNEVDHKTLDVTSIMILISHDHQMSISEGLYIGFIVGRAEFEAHNLYKIHNLLILHDLSMCRITNIEWLTLQGEHSIVVSANNRKTTHSQRLGRVSLGNDQSTILALGSSSMIGVIQLDNSCQLGLLGATLTLESLILLELGIAQNGINGGLLHLLQKLIRKIHFLSKGRRTRREVLLRLTVKCRVLNEAVDKHGEMILDLVGFNLGASLVLLLDGCLQCLGNLIGDIIDMSSTLGGGNSIDK